MNKSKKYSEPVYNLSQNDIVYEDENILIVDKKQNVTVHPRFDDEKQETGREIYLVDMIIGYLYKKGEYDPENENSFSPALCNRLDRNTAGLIVAAKNAESLRIMNKKIKDRELKKIYYCEVRGTFEKKSGVLRDFLYKDRSNNKVFIFSSREEAIKKMKIKYADDIKSIVTKYTVCAEKDGRSLLLVELITGRTHQIRAHLAYYGHPIVGDGKYGHVRDKKELRMHQSLYSYSIEFDFSADSGLLSYLNGRKFCGKGAGFMEKYR